MTNTYTKQFQDGAALTEAQLNTAFTTVKPSLSNLSLSTTGSSAFQVLRSTGSNLAPEYDDIGDVLANGTISGANAEAFAAQLSSTGANAIINEVDSSVSSTGANSILEAATDTPNVNSSVANQIITNSNLGSIDQTTATGSTTLSTSVANILTTTPTNGSGTYLVCANVAVDGRDAGTPGSFIARLKVDTTSQIFIDDALISLVADATATPARMRGLYTMVRAVTLGASETVRIRMFATPSTATVEVDSQTFLQLVKLTD